MVHAHRLCSTASTANGSKIDVRAYCQSIRAATVATAFAQSGCLFDITAATAVHHMRYVHIVIKHSFSNHDYATLYSTCLQY
jgi:hypothetical protein